MISGNREARECLKERVRRKYARAKTNVQNGAREYMYAKTRGQHNNPAIPITLMIEYPLDNRDSGMLISL